jgi:ATP-dependent Zn protease
MQLTSTQIGDTIDVQLTIENVQNLFAWNLNLTWNPTVLNLTNVKEGPFLSNTGSTLFTWSSSISPTSRSQGYIDSVACTLLEATSANGNGILATLSFQVLSTGVSQLSITGTQLASPSKSGVMQFITATLNSGTITIINSSNNNSNGNSNNNSDIPSDNNHNGSTGSSDENPSSPKTSRSTILLFAFLSITVLLILLVGIFIWFKKASLSRELKK